ncbi:MAG: hypothetical protein LBT34_03110 [Clostridiales Family XIII bacterium]|nr:hypothetical protein [Clostridiales Family XIII bacterium]
MDRWKVCIGALLIVAAVAGLVFWEALGRNMILMDEVLVAKENIETGSRLSAEMLRPMLLPKESVIEGSLTAESLPRAQGRKIDRLIQKNQQLSPKNFENEEEKLKSGESFYVLEKSWIAMRSSSLRRGDVVSVFSEDGSRRFGDFKLAFVKSGSEEEVRDISRAGEIIHHDISPAERTDSDLVISHVEIIANQDEYFEIRNFAMDREQPSLILVLHDA